MVCTQSNYARQTPRTNWNTKNEKKNKKKNKQTLKINQLYFESNIKIIPNYFKCLCRSHTIDSTMLNTIAEPSHAINRVYKYLYIYEITITLWIFETSAKPRNQISSHLIEIENWAMLTRKRKKKKANKKKKTTVSFHYIFFCLCARAWCLLFQPKLHGCSSERSRWNTPVYFSYHCRIYDVRASDYEGDQQCNRANNRRLAHTGFPMKEEKRETLNMDNIEKRRNASFFFRSFTELVGNNNKKWQQLNIMPTTPSHTHTRSTDCPPK